MIWLETDPEGLHSPAAEGVLLPAELVSFSCRGKLRGSQVGQLLVDVVSKGAKLRVHAGAQAEHSIPVKNTQGDSGCRAAITMVCKDSPSLPCPLGHTTVM